MPRPLRVGILGLAHLHPRSYMPHFAATASTRVVAACDADRELREAFGAEFSVRVYPSWRRLLAAEPLDAAYVFLPHDECPAAAVACAEAKVHVVVEKPVASTAAGCRRVVEACRQSGVLFSTPYLWRLHPVCRRMKRLVDSGALGKIVGGEGRCAAGGLHRYVEGHAGWMLRRRKSGGGPMLNLGVHWIDLFRWLTGQEIVEVMGRTVRVDPERDIEDSAWALCTFSGGAVLSLEISYTVPEGYPNGRDLYLALRGTEGCLSYAPAFEGTRQTLFVCSGRRRGEGSCQSIDFELDDLSGYCGPLGREFVARFAQDVRRHREPAIGGPDAIRALEVVEAVYRSARAGKAVKLLSSTRREQGRG